MTDHVDMSQFIAARSDQMNADDLLDAPRTITITKVSATPDSAEQPVSVHYEGDDGKAFKPCKTVRRIMVGVWGKDASQYVGRSMTLYRDPTVAFGGMQVGGIRVSHMSHMNGEKTVALMVTRGRKAPFKVLPLATKTEIQPADDQAVALKAITDAAEEGLDALANVWKQKWMAPHREALQLDLDRLKVVAEGKAKPPAQDNQNATDLAPVGNATEPDAEQPREPDGSEPSPHEKAAASWCESFDKAETIIDLKGLYSKSELDRASFNDELSAKVEQSYTDNTARLTKQHADSKAREQREAAEEA